MAEQISLTPKRVFEHPGQQPEMIDADLDRILDEAFEGLEMGNPDGQVQGPSQPDPSLSIPVPDIPNSQQEMFNMMQQVLQQDPRQMLTMQHTMMIELFQKDPRELRTEIMSMMGMMLNETPLPMIASLKDLLGSDIDSDVYYKIADLQQLIGLNEVKLSQEQVQKLVESGALQKITKAEAERLMEECRSKPHDFPQLDGKAREGLISMLNVFGVNRQYHEALLAKNDLIVEVEIAKYSLLSTHRELLPVMVEFISKQIGALQTDLSSTTMTNENSLKDLCKGDQFSQISAEITRYLVDHYQLGS